ncbi:MAG: hypothetical protein H0W62_07465 [Chitinophagales bacterium]|nr:hypothetical protein [Chitinophagales bacterium]
MKKIIIPALAIIFLSISFANAQSAVRKSDEINFIMTSYPVAEEHSLILDRVQQETEDFLLTITPLPSFVQLIAQNIPAKQHGAAEKGAGRDRKKKKELIESSGLISN